MCVSFATYYTSITGVHDLVANLTPQAGDMLIMPEATCQGRPLPGASSLVRAPMRDGKLEDGEVAKVGRGSLRSVAP